MSSASSTHEAGPSKSLLWDNPEGWGGEGGGRVCSGWENIRAPVADSCQRKAKNHHNIKLK